LTAERLQTSDFDYHLPTDLIAQKPSSDRGGSRLLVVRRTPGNHAPLEDGQFAELPRLIPPGDLLVLKTTRVRHARLLGTRPSGGGRNALPVRCDGVDIVFGRPWRTTQQPWPRTREHVAATSVLLRGHLLSELATALADTRRSLPGPLPAGQSEDDPETGLVEPSREL